ncbi:MAG: hypothetical protein NVV68_07545 [Dokdonella sp.]|nr:hypothetical protein [Dokdonella sp.]
MRSMRWAVARSTLASIVAVSPGFAAEPAAQLRVMLGGQELRVEAGRPVEVELDGRRTTLRVEELPYRRFAEAGIAFDYPRHLSWEAEPGHWTLDGNSAVVMVFSAAKGEAPDPDSVLDGIEQSLERARRAPRESILLSARSGALDGTAMTVTLAGSRLRYEAYSIEGRSHDALLVLQDTLTDAGDASAEFAAMRKQLAQTLEF